MKPSNQPIIYKGMTVEQLQEQYNPVLTIPKAGDWLQKNQELGQEIKSRLNPLSDISYGNNVLQKLDIYAPLNAKDLPVLIDIHGGGWFAGDKNPRSIPAEAVMSQDVIWVPIDYGLAPEFRMKDISAHVSMAIAWIYKHIHQYGGDPNRLYLSGSSAGAQLAATTLSPGWNKDHELPGNVIKGMLLVSGVYDLEYLLHSDLQFQQLLQLTSNDVLHFSPIQHPPTHSIPVIIAYGERESEQFHLQSKDFAQALTKAGCKVSLIEIPDQNHFETMNVLEMTDSETYKATMNMIKSPF